MFLGSTLGNFENDLAVKFLFGISRAMKRNDYLLLGVDNIKDTNIINNLKNVGYEGWFVVEAEQDPKICPPLEYAQIGYKSLSDYLIRAGYEIDNYFLGK